jgi:hypothetical protein
MIETVEFPLEAGGEVLVRVQDPPAAGVVTRGGGVTERLERAEQTFEAALGTIQVVAQGVLAQLAELTRSPDEIRVEFGLELTAKAGAVLATAGTSAHLQVGLTWRPQRSAGGDDASL